MFKFTLSILLPESCIIVISHERHILTPVFQWIFVTFYICDIIQKIFWSQPCIEMWSYVKFSVTLLTCSTYRSIVQIGIISYLSILPGTEGHRQDGREDLQGVDAAPPLWAHHRHHRWDNSQHQAAGSPHDIYLFFTSYVVILTDIVLFHRYVLWYFDNRIFVSSLLNLKNMEAEICSLKL